MTDLSRAAYQGGMDHIAALQAKIAKQRSEIARLTQALEKATAEAAVRRAVKVKPLVWEAYTTDEGTVGWRARTSIGRYLAVQSGWFLVGQSGWNEAETAFAAKAAAQADYEARILSALDLNPTQFIGGRE